MTCEDEHQILQFSIDYVCALAETLLCFLCKKLIKQPHTCINSDCSKVFCYLCVHKFDKCPNCHAKYSDKSYLEYYESAEMHQEFLFSMISKFQTENVKLPLLIRKIVAQSNSARNKNEIEVGNSSKQTEFPQSTNDDYSMQIENNPNIINNVALDQTVNDSDEESLSNGNTTSDPAWTPDDSPKPSTKISLRSRIKRAGKGQTKITKEAKDFKTKKPSQKNVASTKSDSLKLIVSKEDSVKNVSDSVEKRYIEDIKAWGVKKVDSLTKSLKRNKPEEDSSEEEFTSHQAADDSVSGFDRLLQECSEEAIKKCSLTETNDSSTESQSELDKLDKLDSKNNNNGDQKFHNAQENAEKIFNQEYEEESSDSKEQNGMSPSVTRLKLNTPKTYGKKQKTSTEFLNHMKNASTLFDLKEDDEEIMEEENDTDEYSKKKSLDSILNKYSLLELVKEGNSPIQKYKSSLKRKSKEMEEKNDSDESNELFKTRREIKSYTRRRHKILEDDETFENLDGSISKNSSVADVNQEQTTKEPRKQSILNKNTSEIESLIQSKKLKIDNIVIEELPSKDFESNQSNNSIDENRKKVDSILSAEKEINIVTKNTRQRRVSKCDPTTQPEIPNSKDTRKNQPRQTRGKKTSESSADSSVINNTHENLENITNKRTRSTPKNTTNTNTRATKIKNSENKGAENTKSTPKTNPKKQPLKTTTSSTKNTKEEDSAKEKIEEKASEINSKFFEQSTPKTNPRKRVAKATTVSDATSNSASSKSTSEYLTPLSETPRSTTASGSVATGIELSTPKTSLGKKGSAFNEPPGKLNLTPVQRTPSTAKKSTVINPMYKRNMKGETPLHTACKKDANKVLSLLKNNMTPNVKDNAGWTPLHDAVSMGKETVVRLLLEAGALVNVPGLDNDTPLHLAVRNERIDLAQLLIQYGADIGLRNINGYKPLEYFDLVHRPDWKSTVLAALQLPRLTAPPAPLPPASADVVLYLDQLDKPQTSLVAQFSRGLASDERAILVSPLLQSNVNILLVSGRGDRLCAPSTNVLRAILSGIKAVDVSWIARCLTLGQIVPTEDYEILATTDHPEARPFKRSAENNEKLYPGLFNGLQVYLARPWPVSCVLSCEEAKDLIRRGGASLLNREPDPESMEAECTPRVMYHVTDPAHPLYRLSQGILYDEQAPPRRLYNMSHVRGLSVEWFRACIQTFSIVPPVNPTLEI